MRFQSSAFCFAPIVAATSVDGPSSSEILISHTGKRGFNYISGVIGWQSSHSISVISEDPQGGLSDSTLGDFSSVSDWEELSVATELPGSQEELERKIIHDMSVSAIDGYGYPRMVPDLSLWANTRHEHIGDWIFGKATTLAAHASKLVKKDLKLINSGRNSRIFEILDDNDAVIKYDSYCGISGSDPVENTLLEAFFLKYLNEHAAGITNQFYYYSSSIYHPDAYGKLSDRHYCSNTSVVYQQFVSSVPIVRFLITEKVGLNLLEFRSTYFTGRVPVQDSVKIGIQMIYLLKNLHFHNIIHNDGHLMNYAVNLKNPTKLLFIDFGRARIVNPDSDFPFGEATVMRGTLQPRGETSPNTPTVWCNAYLSPWESLRHKPSFRDDVYRVFINMVMIIHGESFKQFMDTICNIRELKLSYLEIKQSEYLFDFAFRYPDGVVERHPYFKIKKSEVVFSLAERTKGTRLESHTEIISELLKEALGVVRKTKISDKPDYDSIIEIFTNILILTEENGGIDIPIRI